jgi:hypothetical protein
MKFLKKLGFTLLALLALILIVALFVNGEYSVRKTVEINRSSDDVFEYVSLLKNQDEYSVWAKMDPNMKKTFTGTDGKVGFISAWDSDNEEVGKGEQEITKIIDGERIEMELRFIEPFEANDNGFINTESIGDNKTKVTWGFDGKIGYPWNLMLFMDMEGMLGPDLQEGLDNLKEILESEQE